MQQYREWNLWQSLGEVGLTYVHNDIVLGQKSKQDILQSPRLQGPEILSRQANRY